MAMPTLVVEPSELTPLPRRLLDIISEFPLPPSRNGDEANEQRWQLGGITWTPLPCRPVLVQSAENTCVPPNSTDPAYICVPAVVQTAFRVYDAFNGSTLNFEADDLEVMLRRRLPLMASDAFAHELISGAAGSDMSLSNTAHAPGGLAFGSGATPIWNALAVLETDLGETLSGAQGMIHMPIGLLAQAVVNYGVRLDNGRWETPVGNIVSVDSGYTNAAAPTGGSASASAEDWVYASGPVTYRSTEPRLLGTFSNEFTDIGRNLMQRWMEMLGILKFDPCPVTAALVSYDMEG